MTHQDLRDLLHDQVVDVTSAHLAGPAWAGATQRRRRRRIAAVAGSALAVVLVAGGVALVRDHGSAPQPSPAPMTPSPSPSWTPGTTSDTTYQDLPVWWSPDLDEELELPWIDQMPMLRNLRFDAATTDLGEGKPVRRAVAAFGRGDEIVLVAPDGTWRRVSVDLPAPADDADGNPTARYDAGMLSADGRALTLRQGDGRAVLEIATGAWRDLAGPGEPPPTGPAVIDLQPSMLNPTGPVRVNDQGATAQSWGMGPGIPVRDPAVYFSGPAYLVVSGRPEGASVLAFMTALDDERWMDAPTVVGWLDDDTVVYESIAQDRDLLIAWRVGTHTFRRLGSIPTGWTSSFARLR